MSENQQSERKEALRKQVLEQRQNIPEEEWADLSLQIHQNLLKSDKVVQAEKLHCYVSMNERNEVDTHGLIKELLQQDKELYVPVTKFGAGELSQVKLHSFKELSPNKWGVLEPPVDNIGPQPASYDLLLIPLAAADKNGNRLGYGKGFYDRFLENISGYKMGICFNRFILDEIPSESFDVQLDGLMTEKGFIEM